MSRPLDPYVDLIKSFTFALKQFRLYSEKHPITQASVKKLAADLDRFFVNHDKISLGAMQHRLIVDGEAASDKEAAASDLAREIERLEIGGLSFYKGLGLEEITRFLILMAMRPKALKEKGGFNQAFLAESFPHVKISSAKFALVEEGRSVTEKGATDRDREREPDQEAKPHPQPLISIAQVIQRLRDDSMPGKATEEVLVDSEKIVVELEKKPKEMAQLTLENVQDVGQLEQVIRKIVKFLVDSLLAFLVEQGKDITRALERFAKELQRTLKRLGHDAEHSELKDKIPKIFEEGTDELRIQMMLHTFREHPDDFPRLQKLAARLLKDAGVRQRLMPPLKKELIDAGLSTEETERLFRSLEEAAVKRKKRVTIDAEELEELRLKAENFDQLVELRVKEAVAKLEREKKRIADEKERVDTIIRNLAEGLLVVDKNGKVVLMNPAAERLLNIKQKEKIGRSLTEGLGADQLVAMASGNLKDPDTVAKQVEVFSLNDETKRVLQASTAVIENEDGQTVGMVSVLSDVTREKELAEMKSRFIANVSHELRTPLVAIQKSLGLILDEEVGQINSEQSRFLNIANRNIERLSRLINDLLDVAKLEAGKLSLKPKPVCVGELIGHVISTVETWANDKKITIETQLPEAKIVVEADPDRLTQVLTNIMSNAIKFTPDGGRITVDVRSGIEDDELPGEAVEIGVRDTGIGIAPEDQKRIFEKFVQVSLIQPQGVSSTGLGLTIAREIVELHSGKIWVESELDKGSRFAFRLPKQFHLNEKISSSVV